MAVVVGFKYQSVAAVEPPRASENVQPWFCSLPGRIKKDLPGLFMKEKRACPGRIVVGCLQKYAREFGDDDWLMTARSSTHRI
jgi:hypothetical protein